MELTFSTWRDEMQHVAVLRIQDDQTPTEEKRYAQICIPYVELVSAYVPGDVYEEYVTQLVNMFNRTTGKEVRIVRTAEEMDKHSVPRIVLPYGIGLEYYDA
jgi:hypothetical protein